MLNERSKNLVPAIFENEQLTLHKQNAPIRVEGWIKFDPMHNSAFKSHLIWVNDDVTIRLDLPIQMWSVSVLFWSQILFDKTNVNYGKKVRHYSSRIEKPAVIKLKENMSIAMQSHFNNETLERFLISHKNNIE